MASQLEKLLDSIDPAKTYDQMFDRANRAVNTFEKRKAQIIHWDEFVETLGTFFCHVEAAVLNISPSVYSDSEFNSGRCLGLLSRIYGANGEKLAFDMARTGNEGGLYAVLKAMALRIAEEYAENEIAARASDFIDRLTAEEMSAAMDEYIEKYGRLLPSEMNEGGAGRIKANFYKVLKHHPRMLRTMRNVGR